MSGEYTNIARKAKLFTEKLVGYQPFLNNRITGVSHLNSGVKVTGTLLDPIGTLFQQVLGAGAQGEDFDVAAVTGVRKGQ